MPEIDDARLRDLLAAEELIKRAYSNKETKREFEKIAKKVNPNAITVDDQLEPYVKDLKDELAELKEWKKEMQGNISSYSDAEQIKNLRKNGYTEDGIKAIKDIMEKESIKSYEVAAAYWDKVQSPAPVAPNGISPSMWNFQGDGEEDASMDLLNKNPDAWQDKQIDAWFKEQKSNKGDF